jgi:hypothetical protein
MVHFFANSDCQSNGKLRFSGIGSGLIKMIMSPVACCGEAPNSLRARAGST